MIDVASAIKHYLADTLRLGTLSNGFAHILRRSYVSTGAFFALLALGGVRGDDGCALQIVSDLHINVIQRTVHVQTRPLRGANHLLADAVMHMPPRNVFRLCVQHCLKPSLAAA